MSSIYHLLPYSILKKALPVSQIIVIMLSTCIGDLVVISYKFLRDILHLKVFVNHGTGYMLVIIAEELLVFGIKLFQ